MTKIDIAELKTALAARHRSRGYPNFLRTGPAERAQRLANQRAIGKSLERFFIKTGLNVSELNEMIAKDQAKLRRVIEKERADAAGDFAAARNAYRHGIVSRRLALEHLTTVAVNPSTPFFIGLDTPFLILQEPQLNLDQFIDSHIEPMNSSVRINIKAFFAFDSTSFNFYFIWENESDFFAVVDVTSFLVVNGACDVFAATGLTGI